MIDFKKPKTAAGHGETIDRMQVTVEAGVAWTGGTCLFWYEV